MYIVANFKSNFLTENLVNWLDIVGSKLTLSDSPKIIIAPSFVHLNLVKNYIESKNYNIKISAQNISYYDFGPYTGEVAAPQISEYAEFVIVGHSERKKYFLENTNIINQKLINALKVNLTPIIGISDQKNPQETNNTLDEKINNVKEYLGLVTKNISSEGLNKIIYLYEPDRAISRVADGKHIYEAVSTSEISAVAQEILRMFPYNMIFYGGSINSENIKNYLSIKEISGYVVGSASLDPNEFVKITEHTK